MLQPSDGKQVVEWMKSINVPLLIPNDGYVSTNKKGLFNYRARKVIYR